MITVQAQKNAATAGVYFEKHFERDDYYREKETGAGRWFGKLSRELGLSGPVSREDFDALARGSHPATGEKLTCRQRSGRVSYFDFVCSAPKSVSIVGLVASDERVVDAHQAAAEAAFEFLERSACVRLRKGDKVLTTQRAPTGKILAAAFDHEASRDLDCQLHRHLCVFNVTRSKDGTLMALDARRMYDRSQVGTEVYRNELCRRLLSLGYSVVNLPQGFEIEGVPPSLLKKFSSRSQTVKAMVLAREQKLQRKLSKKEKSLLVHTSRRAKKNVSTSDLREGLRQRLSPLEMERVRNLVPKDGARRGKITGESHVPVRHHKEPALKFFEKMLVTRRGRSSTRSFEKLAREEAAKPHRAHVRQPKRGRARLNKALALRCPGRNIVTVRSVLTRLAREFERTLDMEARIFR
jgi:conjugative relaxase-like TrwC/TraI family protein